MSGPFTSAVAKSVPFDNSTNGFTSTNVQDAIEEVSSGGVTFGSPTTLTPDSGNVDGTSSAAARADHKHDMPTVSPSTIGTVNAEGTSTNFVRADHIHAHGAQTDGTLHAAATTSVNGFMSSSDKAKLDSIKRKAGLVTSGTFSGNPKKATITFSSAFATIDYAITITGVDSRHWSYESKSTGGFVINANANAALTGEVSWSASPIGEIT